MMLCNHGGNLAAGDYNAIVEPEASSMPLRRIFQGIVGRVEILGSSQRVVLVGFQPVVKINFERHYVPVQNIEAGQCVSGLVGATRDVLDFVVVRREKFNPMNDTWAWIFHGGQILEESTVGE